MNFTLRMKYSTERIDREVQRLAGEISADYVGRELLVIVILKGAFVFAADLIRKISVPMEVDFIEIASYCGTDSTGRTIVTKDVTIPVTKKHVLIVEDIIDEGRCLSFLLETLRRKAPASLKVCTLIDNRRRRSVNLEPDFVGIRCDSGFLVGYGLDMNQKYREFPALYEIVAPDADAR
jgi:hypoxanthine phosphoribosyltransferase